MLKQSWAEATKTQKIGSFKKWVDLTLMKPLLLLFDELNFQRENDLPNKA